MAGALSFVSAADGYELRRGDEVVGRTGPTDRDESSATRGDERWTLTVAGDRSAPGATWQVLAADAAGEPAARYYHGGMRGGRVRSGDDDWGTLRRQIGVGSDWRLRMPETALTVRPSADGARVRLDLEYVAGSAEVADLVLLLVCWVVMSEEAVGPLGRGG